MTRATLKAQLRVDEGVKRALYWDTAKIPKATIGVGRNLTDKGISDKAVEFLLDEDVDETIAAANRLWPWWTKLSDARQDAFLNWLFNLGPGRAAGFPKFLAALQAGKYEQAAVELETSAWDKQVGARADRIIAKIRKG